MSTKLRLLILEDDPYDADLAVAVLEESGYQCRWKRIETRAGFLECLDAPDYDLILADHKLPTFDGLTALKLFQERDLDLLFVFVSGELGEENAVESLKAGATDYVLKHHLSRLPMVVARALREKEAQQERKRAERALEESEQRFRSVAQSASEAIVIANEQGQIVFWNKGAQNIFGYREDEALNQALTLLMPKQFREAHQNGLKRLQSGEQPHLIGRVVELHGLRKDGDEFPLELSLTSWQTEKETFYGSIIRDITKRKQTEIALLENRTLLNETGKMAKVGGWIIDLASNELTWTEEVYRIHEVDMSFQPTVETAINFYTPGSRPIIQKAVQKAIESGMPFDLELDLITAKDNKIKVHALGSVRYEGDKPATVMGTFQNITERKRAEEMLKQRADQLALINDIGSKVAAMLDLDTVLDRAAHLVQGMFNYHHVALFLIEEDVLKLRSLAGSYEPYFPAGHTQQLSVGINGWVGTHGKIVVANNISVEPRYTSFIAEHSITQAELCLPLKIAGQTVGVLDIQSPYRHIFTENDVMAMETLTDQLAVAIENARLYEAIQRELSERRQTQAELKASEERFRQAVTSISDHIYMTEVTAEGQHLNHYISFNIEDLTGYPREKFLADWNFWTSIIHSEDREIATRQLNRLVMGHNNETEYRLVQAGGNVIWVRDSGRVEISNGSKFIYGVVSNITERKQAEAALRKQTYDLGERVKELNCLYGITNLIETPGISLVEIMQRTINLIPPGWQYPEITCARIILNGQEFATENFRETVWKQTDNITVYNEQIGVFEVYYLDERPKIDEGPFLKEERNLINAITKRLGRVIERMKTKAALKESEARYQDLYDNAPDMFASVDAATAKIIQCNQTLVTATGYSQDEIIGRPIFKIYHPDCMAEVKKAFRSFVETGEVHNAELQLKRKDGRKIDVSLNVSAIRDEQGNVLHSRSSWRDISERKQAEEEIRKLNESLERRVADRTRELSALYEVTTVASESLDLETTLNRSLERVLEALKSQMGAIHLLDETDAMLHLATQQGLPLKVMLQLDSVSLENSLVGWVAKHRKPLVVSDLGSDPRAPQSAGPEGLRYYTGAPMQASGRVLGTLSVFGRAEQRLSVEEVTLLASIADQVGVAVENARLRRQAEQAAVTEERSRLARDLHDSVTQSLFSLTLFTEWGQELFESGDLAGAKQRMIRIGETARQALKEMRLLVYELRPAALDQDGLTGALQQRLDSVEKRVGVKAHLQVEPSFKLPATVEEGLYRIALEALNNALNHAAAGTVTIRLYAEGHQAILEVTDDGEGFTYNTVTNKGGIGLSSMQERAERLGGSLAIQSVPEKGTTIKTVVPIKTTGEIS